MPREAIEMVIETVVMEHLGEGVEIVANRDGSFSLATKETTNPENNLPVLKYVVVRSYDWKVVEQGAVTMSKIEWASDYEIEISHAQGQVQLQRDTNTAVRRIDLRRHLKGIAPK